MIWAIGDIHGMFDPLKRLVSKLMELHYRGVEGFEIERLVFIGDYIDYGPSSKEVVDFLIDLPFDKVFLMGNHDDLLLQFVKRSDLYEKDKDLWFNGNGGQQTVMSFFPHLACSHDGEDHGGGPTNVTPEDIVLSERHLSFFEGLKLSHVETIDGRKVLFAHALFNPDFPIEEQLAISNYDELHAWRQERGLQLEETFLWNNKEPARRLGDYTAVHGHLATPYIAKDWKGIHGYDPRTKVPFLKFETPEDDDVEIDFRQTQEGFNFSSALYPISIAIDTGLVLGHRLSAVGFGGKWSTDRRLRLVQVATDRGYRRDYELTLGYLYFGS